MGAKTMKKTTTEMRKRTEANARRRVAESWARTGKCMSYKRAAVRETYRHTTDDMKDELFDGFLISLSPRWIKRSMPTHFTTVIIHPIWGENRLKTA